MEETLYEWLPASEWGWTADVDAIADHVCRQPKCDRPAVARFFREFRRNQRILQRPWYCCDLPEHLYGRRIRNGVVEREYMVGSPSWEQARALASSSDVRRSKG